MCKSCFGNDKCKEVVENVCPYCHETLYMNKRVFANHVRWCKANPKYEEIKNSTAYKIKLANTQKQNYKCNCIICGKEYEVNITPHKYEIGKYKKTCSDKCAKQLTASKIDKELHTLKIKNALKKYVIDNNIKKFHYCKNCGKLLADDNRRLYCSDECYLQYKLKGKKQKQIYKYFCKFTFSLNDFPDEFDFNLIKQFGWYKAKNRGDNLLGVSRDHKYSCEEGFKHLIDPYLISHPANCKLLQHIENSSKYIKCSITIDELQTNVINWNKKYGEYPNKINYKVLEHYNIIIKK